MSEEMHKEIIMLHQALVGIQSSLVRLEQMSGQLDRKLEDHEFRIRDLEKVSYKAKGALAAYATLGGVVSGGFVALIQYLLT